MSVFAEPALLVPIHVDALVMGSQPRKPFQWSRLTPDYGKLQTEFFLGPDLTGDPFDEAPGLETGVHLHFRLPRALFQGYQSEKTPLTFPAIPDRWLVQRVAAAGTGASHQAWLIRSDREVSRGGTAWPIFAADKLSVVRLGSAEKLTAPPGAEDRPSNLALTAIGVARAGSETRTAHPLFSAHYPASRHVLGFHDDLGGIGPGSRLCYLVTGWYSRADEDLLWTATKDEFKRQEDFKNWLEQRKWTCAEAEGKPEPRRMLCHGVVRGLVWSGPQHDYFDRGLFSADATRTTDPAMRATDPSVRPGIDVAIGQTPAEALAALLQNGEVEQDLLTALQDGLLVAGSTIAKLRSDLHSHRFDAAPGGSVYTLSPEAETDEPATPGATPSEPPAELLSKLDELNQSQADCDVAARNLEDHRQQLHSLWFLLTSERKKTNPVPNTISTLNTQLAGARTAFSQSRDTLKNAITRRDAIHTAKTDGQGQTWTAEDAGSATTFRVTRIPITAFQFPREPAVALAGKAMAPFNTAERRGGLRCRREPQVLTGVILPVTGARPVPVSGEELVRDMLGATPAAVDGLHLLLFREALLLDRDNAGQIARLAGAPNAEAGLRADDFWNTPSNLQGRPPDPISQFDHPGTNPWIPMMLVWEVEWRPEREAADAQNPLPPDAVSKNWTVGDDAELQRNAKPAELGREKELRITGQSLLLSGAAAALRDRLTEAHGLQPDLANRPMAVQSLGGFNQALVMRRLAALLPAFNWRRWITEKILYLDPIQADLASGETPLRLAPRPGPFLPLRAGQLKIARLNVVDAFGQTIQLTVDKIGVACSCRGASDSDIRLRPRMIQPARLQLDWADTICGWIVPNHLDLSLTLHGADGRALMILQKKLKQTAGTPDRAAFYWAEVPGTASSGPDGIADADLRAFCEWVLGLDPDEGAMLFSLIGEQIDAADQRTPEAEPLLSVLVGHPLALVRGSLRLELAGPHLHPPDTRESRGIGHVSWPIFLGDRRAKDDGLVGFFRPEPGAGLAARGFFPAWRHTQELMSEKLRQQFKDQSDLVVDAAEPLPLVLLMDPLARVYVTSGVLPVTKFELPPRMSEGRRRAREAFFQTAPVLGFGQQPEMPKPSDDYGEWSWFWRPDVTAWKAADHLVEAAERGGFDDRWPNIAEGWLKLRIDPLKLLSFWVQDTDKPVARGSRPRLAWVQQGADRLELSILSPNPRSVRVWHRPPFPSTYAVEVQEETTFQLKASAAGVDDRCLELTVQVDQ